MDIIKLVQKLKEDYKVNEIDKNNYVLSLPFYYYDSGEGFPLAIHINNSKSIILTDLGKALEKIFGENEEYYQKNKNELQLILKDFDMELNEGYIELSCEPQQVLRKISTYLQALSVLNYLFG